MKPESFSIYCQQLETSDLQFNDKLSLFPFIHSFRKFLLSPSYVPGGTFLDVLGTASRLCLHPTQTTIVEIAEDPSRASSCAGALDVSTTCSGI